MVCLKKYEFDNFYLFRKIKVISGFMFKYLHNADKLMPLTLLSEVTLRFSYELVSASKS